MEIGGGLFHEGGGEALAEDERHEARGRGSDGQTHPVTEQGTTKQAGVPPGGSDRGVHGGAREGGDQHGRNQEVDGVGVQPDPDDETAGNGVAQETTPGAHALQAAQKDL